MNYPLLHWDILELIVKRYSCENSLAETCKRLLRARTTKKKYVSAFMSSLTAVKWMMPNDYHSGRQQVSQIVTRQRNIPMLKQMKHDGCLVIDDDVLHDAYDNDRWTWRKETPTSRWLFQQAIKTGFDDWPEYTTIEQDEFEDRWECFYEDAWLIYLIDAHEHEENMNCEFHDHWTYHDEWLASLIDEYEYEENMRYEDDLLDHWLHHNDLLSMEDK